MAHKRGRERHGHDRGAAPAGVGVASENASRSCVERHVPAGRAVTRCLGPAAHDRPTTSPFSSMSMRSAAGCDGQAGHGAHVAADGVDESRAHRGAHLADRKPPARRRPSQARVRGDRQVGLGDADGQVSEAVALVAVELPGCGRCVVDAVGAVDPGGDGLDLLAQRCLARVQEPEFRGLLGRLGHGFGQLDRPPAAVGEVGADGRCGPPWRRRSRGSPRARRGSPRGRR